MASEVRYVGMINKDNKYFILIEPTGAVLFEEKKKLLTHLREIAQETKIVETTKEEFINNYLDEKKPIIQLELGKYIRGDPIYAVYCNGSMDFREAYTKGTKPVTIRNLAEAMIKEFSKYSSR